MCTYQPPVGPMSAANARTTKTDFSSPPSAPRTVTRLPKMAAWPWGQRASSFWWPTAWGAPPPDEIASEMATVLIHDRLLSRWILERGSSPRDFAFSLEEAITRANLQIHRRATDDPQLQGMGSTLTAVGVLGEHLVFTQVGDSRAYQIREDKVTQVTKDQSLVRHLMEEGQVRGRKPRAWPVAT